jgi:uncharacterized protein (TIGR00255 family)
MRSMTGYGAGRAGTAAVRVSVEIRSVNQRFLDVKLSLPREYAAWERELRQRVTAVADRGRVEVQVARVVASGKRRYRVAARTELARAWVMAARRLGRELGLPGDVDVGQVLRLPDVLEVVEQPPDVARELPVVRRALAAALAAFDAERRREGAALARDMRARTAALVHAVREVRRRLPAVRAALALQMEKRLARLVPDAVPDRGRVAQEVAMLIERGDVTEELVRLDSHLAALHAALGARGPVGKRIEFLLQEIGREINTTGAKAGDVAIAELVLGAKGELEKLREQVQNVE